jgi:glycolate oxidase FAD binding subunit
MLAGEIVRPADAGELQEVVAEAAANCRVLEIRGGGSKRDIGVPERETTLVDLGALSGVVDYEPSELVLTARPATSLAEVERLLADHGQMLAFDPWDHGPLFDRAAGSATIGGIVAAGIAGPRRVSAGGVRDHLLGFSAVSGRGEAFKGGGKVVKNVTGYDISKVMAGSWGQLAIMTELSLKVVPRPRTTNTVVLPGLSADAAVAAMSQALGSPCAPAAAAHLPGSGAAGPRTALRLEGFRESVEARTMQLRKLLAEFAEAVPLEAQEDRKLWTAIREAYPLGDVESLWRAHVAPSCAAALVDALERLGARWLYDWGGALVWIGAPASAQIHAVTHSLGGHAKLIRGAPEQHRMLPFRQTGSAGAAALASRVKQAFDPAGVLDPERFG